MVKSLRLNKMKKYVFNMIALVLPFQLMAEPLVLTGKVSSAKKQVVTAPQTSRWQIQIQWMEEEGKVVNSGDTIVVFDGSDVQSRLDINEERAETLALELKQTKMELEQKLTEAQGQLKVAKMRVEKARIEASVPASEVSQYDKGQYELTLQRMLLEQVKAEEKLKLAQEELRTGVQKKRLDLLKVGEEIAFQQRQLKNLNVTADFTGPISYAMHPWSGQKMAAGVNAQASWTILDVQATENFQIESWVHEIDADKLGQDAVVELALDAYPNKRYQGKLAFKSTQSEKKEQWSGSVYFPVTFTFSQMPEEKLLPGMSVRVLVPGSDSEVARND